MAVTTSAPARPRTPVEVVAGNDPEALSLLCTAAARGDVPVVTDASMPAPMREAVLEATARRLADPSAPLPSEPLLVVLTSGSSGAPRAVVRTLRSWTACHRKIDVAFGLRPDDVIWAPGSLSSTLTLFAAHHARTTKRRSVLSGPWRGVEAALVHGAATATVVQAVPTIAADVLDAAAEGLLPALRTVVVAGAHVPSALHRRAERLGVRLVEYYGAAELSFVVVDGDPAPGADVRLRLCEHGSGVGEIWVRSPYLALGYVEGDGPLRVEDGWASVGDLGRVRPDGSLEVLGRGDAVTVGGHTVSVADVESALARVDGVRELVCLGEANDRLGQLLVAAVRADTEVATDVVEALKAAARERLPHPARPTRYVVLDELPRTAAGKADRGALAALVVGTRPTGATGDEDATETVLR